MRDQRDLLADVVQDEIIASALGTDQAQGWIGGRKVVRTIYVLGKLVSLVVK